MKDRKEQLQTVISNLEKRVALYRKRLMKIQQKEGDEKLKGYIGKCYLDEFNPEFMFMITHVGKKGDPEGILLSIEGKGKKQEASMFTSNYLSWEQIKHSKEISRVRFKVELNRAIKIVTSKIV